MIYFELFITFFKIGAFTFGGGYAMLPLIQDVVLSKGWISNESLLDFIAISESTPGPFAVNIATFIGAEKGGISGAFCATFGVVLPSFIIILVVAAFFSKFKDNKFVKGCMFGLKPAVVGLIGAAVLSVATTVFIPDKYSLSIFKETSFYISLVIFIICIALALKKKHPILIVCLSAILGIISGYIL